MSSNEVRIGVVVVVQTPKKIQCERCGIYIDDDEYICGFGICDSCFEEKCPCNEGRPEACPLHEWPDVRLEYASKR